MPTAPRDGEGGWPPILQPDVQIDFYLRLEEIRKLSLHDALAGVIGRVELATVDDELTSYVQVEYLRRLAASGIRGEVFFPVPIVLSAKPSLIGYYRLLYGLSQKEFYSGTRFGRFKRMEELDDIGRVSDDDLIMACRSLCATGTTLLSAIPAVSLSTVHDLQLLTLGAQFRGSRNTDIGQTATRRVFDLIAQIASKYVKVRTETNLIVVNPAGRTITVKFAHDPDVAVEDVTGGEVRPIVSIEIKGGGDVSNIHNRIGEAEKSHQKARARGFYRFWTILGAKVDPTMAARESPTTNDSYQLGEIQAPTTQAAKEFKGDISAVLNIPAPRAGRRRT